MENDIIIYGTQWCGDTRRAVTFFKQYNIPYHWVDIDLDKQGQEYVMKVNKGNRSVPTILFPDGTILVEPTTSQLKEKLKVD